MFIHAALYENIFLYRWRYFLQSNGSAKGSNATETDIFLQNFVRKSDDNLSLFNKFLIDELKYGKNRRIFYTKHSLSSNIHLKSLANVEQYLKDAQLSFSSFNNLNKEYPEDEELLFLELNTSFSTDRDVVNKIDMCFFKEIEGPEPTIPDQDRTILLNYIWIEIDLLDRAIYISCRPYPSDAMKKGYTMEDVYNETKEKLRSIFDLVFVDSMQHSKHTLYKIYDKFIQNAELPYRQQIERIEDNIFRTQTQILELLNIDMDSQMGRGIITRYKRLLEREMILNDLDTYNSYHTDRIALVKRIIVTDDTGANANVLSGEEAGLDVAKIYLDIKETIEEVQKLDKLWVNWFIEDDGTFQTAEASSEQISFFEEEEEQFDEKGKIYTLKTRFTCYNSYVEIAFLDKQSITKEVQEYVLSKFREFEKT
ncbi:hypothetical protein ABZ756_00490 [Mammaliicoccus sciuri]